ncbi:OX-2 membrane glycoprotein-like isoform X2 [Ranitomeya imitator]|uniref:OX-2 membrane glycoprotein-like isoform X2 n=1 Tax=Ranitomeya imitator TaxID=111125 RepID=UPI0037E8DAA5
MDKTGSYFFFVWLLILLSFAHGSDVKIEVGPVEYGKSVTLKCILYPHFFPVQVTWTRLASGRTTTVATYASDSGAEISEGYKDRLWMSTLGLNETAITINKASIQDEGCYRCTFNYLPKGSITEAACLTIPGEVLIEKHHVGRLLQPVTLRCVKRKPSDEKEKVVQISWQKNGKNIATYKDGENIEPEYRGVISVTMEGSDVAVLTLLRVNVSDEGKYKCLFNIFPGGSAAGETSLQVYVPLQSRLSTLWPQSLTDRNLEVMVTSSQCKSMTAIDLWLYTGAVHQVTPCRRRPKWRQEQKKMADDKYISRRRNLY